MIPIGEVFHVQYRANFYWLCSNTDIFLCYFKVKWFKVLYFYMLSLVVFFFSSITKFHLFLFRYHYDRAPLFCGKLVTPTQVLVSRQCGLFPWIDTTLRRFLSFAKRWTLPSVDYWFDYELSSFTVLLPYTCLLVWCDLEANCQKLVYENLF